MKIKQSGIIIKKPSGKTPKTVCFTCRKCFHASIKQCVECSGDVQCVGFFFTAPKKSDIKKWKILEKMVILGNYRFSQYGATGPIPENLKKADAMLSAKRKEKEPRLSKSSLSQMKDVNGKLIPWRFRWSYL